jgi:hypothetical protein
MNIVDDKLLEFKGSKAAVKFGSLAKWKTRSAF